MVMFQIHLLFYVIDNKNSFEDKKAGTVHATEITCLCHKNVMKTRMLNIVYRRSRRSPMFDLFE